MKIFDYGEQNGNVTMRLKSCWKQFTSLHLQTCKYKCF